MCKSLAIAAGNIEKGLYAVIVASALHSSRASSYTEFGAVLEAFKVQEFPRMEMGCPDRWLLRSKVNSDYSPWFRPWFRLAVSRDSTLRSLNAIRYDFPDRLSIRMPRT